MGGCGGAEEVAEEFHGEVVNNDAIKMRDLPPALQQLMMPLSGRPGDAAVRLARRRPARARPVRPRRQADTSAPSYRRSLQPAQRGTGQLARPPLSARPAPRRDHRISLTAIALSAADGARIADPRLRSSLGDPAGIGPEVVAKCWDNRDAFAPAAVLRDRRPALGRGRLGRTDRALEIRGRPTRAFDSRCR